MPSQIAEIPFGQWLPDIADYKNPGVTEATNVYPTASGFGPFASPIGQGVSISGDIRGTQRLIRSDGTIVLVVGTEADLFVVINGVVTASSLALSLPAGTYWSFVRFNAQLWAFARGIAPKYLANIDTDTGFVDHPGTAPQSAAAGRVGDFIVTGNMVDIDASDAPYRVRWSQFNNPAGNYGTDIATQSGFVDMPPQFGQVIGIFGGRSDVILQKYGVHRISYTGGSTAFRLDIIEEGRGCVSFPSVVTVGSNVYFLSNDGFARTDGANVQMLSDNRVWRWFQENSSAEDLGSVQGAVNWPARSVVWNFVKLNGQGFRTQIIYNFEHNKWSTAGVENQWIYDTIEPGVSLEQLSTDNPNLDAMTISLDSASFKPKERALSAVIGGELSDFSGPPLQAHIATGEFQLKTGYRTCTSTITPLVENLAENTAVAVGAREAFKGEAIDWSPYTPVGIAGFAPVIKDGRYQRAAMRIPSGAIWDQATGLQVEFNVTGRV